MGEKVITCTLDERSIDQAINELIEYKKEVEKKTNLLRQRIAERITEIAQTGFSTAIVDDLLPNSGGARYARVDVSTDDRENVTVVIANGTDAVWVEFGAGVFHNGSVGGSPHPNGVELGMIIGGYGKGHGSRKVWGFYEGGALRLTHGTPASMPLYNAMKTVCDNIVEIAREIWR